MRFSGSSSMLKARAIAGTHVVVLAWDVKSGKKSKLAGLLGFAIERAELDANDAVIEKYWLRAIKRFKDKDKGLPPGTPVPTSDHPVQSFQWGDYTARSSHRYRYRIVPMYGAPKLLAPDDAAAVEIDVSTEPDAASPAAAAASGIRHDVYFNRGVIGSQAYAREFGNAAPDAQDPQSREMVWLSHGLYEALQGFIALAASHEFGLRAAFYEFRYQQVANALASVIDRGADVKIVYDAESTYKVDNQATIVAAGLDQRGAVIPRTVTDGIRHNKFMVLTKSGQPIAVWTGSTNISAGGIFGHSNVGHVVWDAAIARKYLDYWTELAQNKTSTKLRPIDRAATPTPAGKPAKHSVTALFSARDEPDAPSPTLQWYADRMAEAKKIMCFTVAFDLDPVFRDVLARQNDVIRYVVKDDDLATGDIISQDHDVLFAAGTYLRDDWLANFRGERDNPLNTNDFIHTKIMLVDPLSADPLVISGSANFSQNSQTKNDENMLVIRGDTRVADIYFGEYMRVFDHHYARYVVRKLRDEGRADPDAGYLKETSAWTKSHFDPASSKSKRRRYFVG